MSARPKKALSGDEILSSQRGPSGPYLSFSDQDIFDALDLSRPGLASMREAVDTGDADMAFSAWGRYWAGRTEPNYAFDRDRSGYHPDLDRVILAEADRVLADDFCYRTLKPKRKGLAFELVYQLDTDDYFGFMSMYYIRDLGPAWQISGDDRYAECLQALILNFVEQLPDIAEHASSTDPRSGHVWDGLQLIWNDGLSSSIRTWFLLDAYWTVRTSDVLSAACHRACLRLFLGQSRYVFDQGIQEFSDDNFQATRCRWLMSAGVFLPEFKESGAWADAALRNLEPRIRGYMEDGMQAEQCMQYHLAGLNDILIQLFLLDANARNPFRDDKELWNKLRAMYEAPLRQSHPGGHTAVFNSTVYGTDWQVFMPRAAELFDSDFLRWGVRRFMKADFIPVAKDISRFKKHMDGHWFQARDAAVQAEAPEPDWIHCLFPESGIAVLRSGWTPDDMCLVLDANLAPWGGHAYPGRLSFDFSANGMALVTNPGSYLGYTSSEHTKWLDQTLSHNTVMIGGQSQDRPYTATICGWHASDNLGAVAAATRTNEERTGVVHERIVLMIGGDYVFIIDSLHGGSQGVPVSWLLHSPQPLALDADGVAATPGGQPGLIVVPDPVMRLRSRAQLGAGLGAVPVQWHADFKPGDPWRHDIPFLRYDMAFDAGASGIMRSAVLILPFSDEAPEYDLRVEGDDESRAGRDYGYAVTTASGTDVIRGTMDDAGVWTVHVQRESSDDGSRGFDERFSISSG